MSEPIDRVCEGCGALAGRPCLAPTGRVAAKMHMHRITGHRRSVEAANANRTRNRESYRAKRSASR